MEVEKQIIQNNNYVQQVSGKHPKDWVDVEWMRFVLLFFWPGIYSNELRWEQKLITLLNQNPDPKQPYKVQYLQYLQIRYHRILWWL